MSVNYSWGLLLATSVKFILFWLGLFVSLINLGLFGSLLEVPRLRSFVPFWGLGRSLKVVAMSTLNSRVCKQDEETELRKGPWTLEEDNLLIHYIACHGEGRWNLLARYSGLKRTGKSCRLRWLNYLKPDVKRGNLSPEEQLLILELHSKWGNRWSRIAQHLPGRTDNDIKNYWRTRVQKQARQLKIDANSTTFRDAIRCFWMPRLLQKMESSAPIKPIHPTPTLLDQVTQLSPPESLTASEQPTESNSNYTEKSSPGDCSPSTSSDPRKLNPQLEISEFPTSPHALGNIFYSQFLKGDCTESTDSNHDLEALHLASMMAPGFNYSFPECSMIEGNWADDVVDIYGTWMT